MTQAADYVSSSSSSCCLVSDQKHTLHGASLLIAPAVMCKREAFAFRFYGFSTLGGSSPAGEKLAGFIESGALAPCRLVLRREGEYLGGSFGDLIC